MTIREELKSRRKKGGARQISLPARLPFQRERLKCINLANSVWPTLAAQNKVRHDGMLLIHKSNPLVPQIYARQNAFANQLQWLAHTLARDAAIQARPKLPWTLTLTSNLGI